VKALYAYFMTRPPIRATAQSNTLPFPLNIRLLQAGWKLLFVANRRYQPDTTKSAEWNRGAYLAEGLSHCGACHTPRNLLGAERSSQAYAGAVIDGWIAPPLTDANPAPAPWSQADLFSYRDGMLGVMMPGFGRALSDRDIHCAMHPSRTQADIEIRIGEPSGSQRSSSFRVHCTRTGRPGTARASMAASMAASSAPLWP